MGKNRKNKTPADGSVGEVILPKETKNKKKSGKKAASSVPSRKASVFGSPIRNLIVAAIVAIVVGVVFFVWPDYVYLYCNYAIGGLMALVGLVYILIYFLRRAVLGVYRSEFAVGLMMLLAGAYVAVSGMVFEGAIEFTPTLIVQILGVIVALDGIMKLQYMFDMLRMGYKKWWLAAVTAVLGIALGVAINMGYVADFGRTLSLGVMRVLGICFWANAIFDLITMVIVILCNIHSSRKKAVEEAEQMVAGQAGKDDGFFAEAGEPEPAAAAEPEWTVEPPAAEEPLTAEPSEP